MELGQLPQSRHGSSSKWAVAARASEMLWSGVPQTCSWGSQWRLLGWIIRITTGPKAEPGPSDERSKERGTAARDSDKPTAGGVDANASKEHLLGLARRLDIPGRSKMSKAELVTALRKANDRATAKARG
jgi:hypothetical protein